MGKPRQGAEGSGRWAPLTLKHWLFIVTAAPPLSTSEENPMLLGAGDKLLFEEADREWNIRVEFLNPASSKDIQDLPAPPQANKPDIARATQPRGKTKQTLPRVAEETSPAQPSDSGASSSHEAPRSYYPKPTKSRYRSQPHRPQKHSLPQAQHTHTQAAFVDRRPLRGLQQGTASQNAPPTQPLPQQAAATPLAAALHDGRTIGCRQTPATSTPAPAPRPDNEDEPSSLVQTQAFTHNKMPAETLPDSPTLPTATAASVVELATSSDEPQAPQPATTNHHTPTRRGDMRSWQRVEQHLVAIRRIAETYDDSQSAKWRKDRRTSNRSARRPASRQPNRG